MSSRDTHRRGTRIRAAMAALVALAPCALAPAQASAVTAGPAPHAARATSITRTSVSLRWEPVAGATGYDVLRDGAARATTGLTAFTDTGLAEGRMYVYRVRTRFPAGVTSATSRVVPAVTRAPVGCTLHATPGGNDAWPGTADRPFRTISRLATALDPGGVGCVSGAFVEDVTIRAAGTLAHPVVIRSRPGQRARVRGRMWVPAASHHVVVQDLDIDGRNAWRLPSPTINGSHVTFLRNDVTNHDTAICFLLGSIRGWGVPTGTVIDSNRIHRCGVRPAANHHHGIYVENARSTWITNNVIFGNADRGVQLYPNAIGSVVARNVIDGNGQGVIFSGAEGYASSGNLVADNVVTNARIRYDIEHWWAPGNPIGRSNRAVANCLWGGHDGLMLLPTVGYVARGTITANPRFADRRRGDFRATPTSGCRWLLAPHLPLAGFR